MNNLSLHNIGKIKATASTSTDGLQLDLSCSGHWYGDTTVHLYADDKVLSQRLADAINKVVSEREAELEAAKQPETEAA